MDPERHRVRGALIAASASALPFLIMCSDVHSQIAVPVGFLSCLVATWGLFDCLGTLEVSAESTGALPGRALGRKGLALSGSVLALVLCLRLAVAGVLPVPILSAAVLVTGTFLACVVTLYRFVEALGAFKSEPTRRLVERHGFWLVVLNTLLYLPLLGSYSLSDPWEVHYGEVAREMLARDDWISLWWAQDGWFWSKPVLNFWMQGLSFSLLGVGYQPDTMLIGFGAGRFPQPEWAARMPVFLMALLANYVLYKAVARVFGRRAGLLSGIALVTLPYWYLLSHQTMTDMPYVAPLTAGMGFFLLGICSDPEQQCRTTELRVGSRTWQLSAYHLLYGAIILCVLPQILYLLSRNVSLHLGQPPYGFRLHLDEFFSGSGGGNCGLPGNEICRDRNPLNLLWQPAVAALVWSALMAVFLVWRRRERRIQRLYFMAAWLCAVLAAMAKGAPGLLVPVFAILVFILGTGRIRQLGRLELLGFFVLLVCIVLPWYLQMLARHGSAFLDRLLFHDMWKRAFVHVHDTNDSVDTSFRYYVWQLGYGLFPWTGLGAAGLVWWLRRDVAKPRDAESDAATLMALWFISSFGLFTLSLTKFHHYILPAVPPIAVLTGILLNEVLTENGLPKGRQLWVYLTALGTGALFLVYGVLRFFRGAVGGWLAEPNRPPERSVFQGALALTCAVGFIGLAIYWTRRTPKECVPFVEGEVEGELGGELADVDGSVPADGGGSHWNGSALTHLMFGALAIGGAVVVALVGRDFFSIDSGSRLGQLRLLHLITYNYRRGWPKTLDFDGILLAFVLVSIGACFLLSIGRVRDHAIVLFCWVCVWWTAWGVNVYLVKTAPHWGQRESIAAYYRDRKGPAEQIVAYQMNWKGENFYTGNKLATFVSSQAPFKKWLTEQKDKGARVMYFSTEHGRVSGLKRELGDHKSLKLITDEKLNNKFVIARVEF